MLPASPWGPRTVRRSVSVVTSRAFLMKPMHVMPDSGWAPGDVSLGTQLTVFPQK